MHFAKGNRNESKMAGAVRSLDSRWIRRYRLFFIIGSIILSIQVFLAYKFFSIEPSDNQNGLDRYDPSWRDKVIVIESPGQNEDPNGAASSRRIKDDDEDSPSNSVNSMYNKHKVPPDKIADTQHSELSRSAASNRTSLRLNELDFVPACDIAAKEAVSAIHRAKTQRCKQLLANVTCLIQSGKLYPTRLTNTCPAPGLTAGKSLGCYQDDKTFRLLSGYYAKLAASNTPVQCVNMCLQSGFPYAGVEYSSQCFCGAEQPAATARLPDSSCNMKCSGDGTQVCGGFLTVGVYETGVAKFTAQVARDAAPAAATAAAAADAPARVVFLLTLNGRAVRQVRRLIKLLYHTQHFFYIHVDVRQDYMFRELLPLERQLGNVRISRSRSATIWGGASLLQMLLRSMDELLNLDWPWDFVVNLSESDLPVKSNTALVDFLTANKGRNFVKSHGREVQRFIQKQGLDKTFLECDQHMWRIGSRALPWGVTMDGGSDWMALSRPFVAFVARRGPLVTSLMVIFQYTLLPAESFFHTVLRNTEFCDSYVDNNLHVTNWKRRLGCKCQYKHVVDWCGCSPNDFKLDDWPRIQATESRQLFFARKFEPVVDQAVIHRVDEWLYGPYSPAVASLERYWQSTYHHADLSPPPDDALVTIAWSVARRTAKESRGARVLRLLEVTSFYEKDVYRGALVLYEVDLRDGSQPLLLESWTRFQTHTAFSDGPDQTNFKSVVVSTEFDVKEQVCHNAMNAIGPFSEPVLAVAAAATAVSSFNTTALWIDPVGRVLDVQEMHVDPATGLLSTSKAVLLPPLLPGVWTVKLVQAAAVAATTSFLVTPLYNVNKQTAGLVHKNVSPPHALAGDWDSFVGGDQSQRDVRLRGAELNARRVGEDLEEWIDALSARFYVVKASCVSGTEALGLKQCEGTSWSSLAADPKSHVGAVNETTGRLLR